MKLVKVCLAMLSLVMLVVACASTGTDTTNRSQPGTPDVLAVAKTNYEKHCTSCHGETGDGGLVKVEEKQIKVPSLLKGHVLTDADDKLAKQIANGDDEMPAFKDKLSPAEINDLVRFIRKEFQGK